MYKYKTCSLVNQRYLVFSLVFCSLAEAKFISHVALRSTDNVHPVPITVFVEFPLEDPQDRFCSFL